MARNARTVSWLMWTVLGVSAAACGGGDGTKPPPGLSCSTSAGQSVTLSLGAYTARPPLPSAGCFIFPGNASTTDSTFYLLAGQLATDAEGATAAFILDGDISIVCLDSCTALCGAGRLCVSWWRFCATCH